MEQEATYVGIDVAKAPVDVAVRPTGQRWVVSYDETWVEELVSQMVDLGPPWCCWRLREVWNCLW